MSKEEGKQAKERHLTGAERVYPFGYFDVQTRFAYRWAALTKQNVYDVMQTKTSLVKRLIPNNSIYSWYEQVSSISEDATVDEISQALFALYCTLEESKYIPPQHPENDGKHFGFFAFDHYDANPATEEGDRIKVHFINKFRGEVSSLDRSYLSERQNDLKRMFRYIRQTFPNATEVIGGSWLYNVPSYRESFPAEFTRNMKRLVPKEFAHIPGSVPRLSFSGDSVWGQFLDRRGGVRKEVVSAFLDNVRNAQTLEELVNAFPNFTYQPKALITIFYDWIGYRT